MTIPFRLLRDALSQLSLGPQEQRDVLAGSVVTDELALDLDNAMLSLQYESQRTGIVLDDALVTALHDLLKHFDAPPNDPLWDDESLDNSPELGRRSPNGATTALTASSRITWRLNPSDLDPLACRSSPRSAA